MRDSILECFEANRTRYPVILPDLMDKPAEELAHLRLHNGTIWRWNRPLIGFDDAGRPHCRIEHRVIAAGPSPRDAIANCALFLGLFESFMRAPGPIESLLSFVVARDNFTRLRGSAWTRHCAGSTARCAPCVIYWPRNCSTPRRAGCRRRDWAKLRSRAGWT